MINPVPRRLPTTLVALTAAGLLAACSGTPAAAPSAAPSADTTSAAAPSASSSSAAPSASSSSAASPSEPTSASSATTPDGALVIDIILVDGTVTPNGTKYDVAVGQTVVLNVTSDHDDEIHVHSEPEVELEVIAGTPVSTQFVTQQSGSFEVEAHHPEKIIAILNVR